MPSPNQITVAQLARLLGTPDCPVIVDVCIDEDFSVDPRIIPSSFRHAFSDMSSLVRELPNSRVVVYCHKGKKLSMGAAAVLRCEGIEAEYLEGGKVAWQDAGQPLLPLSTIPLPEEISAGQHRHSTWVTRHRPKIDRIACPWLIRRFVDPRAQFLFVAPSSVLEVAEKFNATPFDVEGIPWSHHGDRCTFDTMLEQFKLDIEPLQRVATIVRGADTDRPDLAPQCAGLSALSLGLSRMYRDDLAQLQAGMLLYDALFRWARDASDEIHDWPGALDTQKTR